MKILGILISLFTISVYVNSVELDSQHSQFVIATDGLYPPYTYVNEAGELDGFETALLKEACKMAQVNCSFKYLDSEGNHLKFGDLLPGLKKGYWDMAYGDMGITDDRINEGFNFIISYKPAKFFFGKKEEDFNSLPDGLNSKVVGVEKNTKFVEYTKILDNSMKDKGLEGFKNIIEYDDSDKLKAALLSGEIQVTPMPDGTIGSLLKDPAYQEFSKIGPELVTGFSGQVFGNQGAGFAVRKEEKKQYLIGQALQEMLFNCSYTEIHNKYLINLDVSNNYLPSHCKK